MTQSKDKLTLSQLVEIHQNAFNHQLVRDLAGQLADTMRENEWLKEGLKLYANNISQSPIDAQYYLAGREGKHIGAKALINQGEQR